MYAPPFRDEKIRRAKKKLDFTVGAAFSDCKEKTLGPTSVGPRRRRHGAIFSCIRSSPR
jgi:hypothetical protein